MQENRQTSYFIDSSSCIACGICQKECPAHCIKEENGALKILNDRCIECGHCGAVCPQGAISCNEEVLTEAEAHDISPEAAFSLIAGKRSVRSYKSKPLPADVLEKILETGAMTGTASNSRDVRAHVYSGTAAVQLRRDLCLRLWDFVNRLNNPVGRTIARLAGEGKYSNPKVLSAFARNLLDGAEGDGDPLFFHAPTVMVLSYPKSNKRFGRTNTVLAGQSMMLYAHALGIESCMIGFAEMGAKGKKGKKILGIDKKREVGLIFTLGYGTPKYFRLPKRRSILDSDQ
ncbi:MAG: nitroreductase family protein [Spirochaetales bacterium]|nr:nitroreductase family protein [Spirochaetales bacterium]